MSGFNGDFEGYCAFWKYKLILIFEVLDFWLKLKVAIVVLISIVFKVYCLRDRIRRLGYLSYDELMNKNTWGIALWYLWTKFNQNLPLNSFLQDHDTHSSAHKLCVMLISIPLVVSICCTTHSATCSVHRQCTCPTNLPFHMLSLTWGHSPIWRRFHAVFVVVPTQVSFWGQESFHTKSFCRI